MKNKKITTCLLVLAVLLIWGIIIYKVVMRGSEKTPVTELKSGTNDKLSTKEFKYRLLLDYPDPFFPQREYHKESQKSDNPGAIQTVTINWPNLKYYGCISSEGQIRALVGVEGKSQILKPQDILAGQFVLKQIMNDSILIAAGNEKKWFKK